VYVVMWGYYFFPRTKSPVRKPPAAVPDALAAAIAKLVVTATDQVAAGATSNAAQEALEAIARVDAAVAAAKQATQLAHDAPRKRTPRRSVSPARRRGQAKPPADMGQMRATGRARRCEARQTPTSPGSWRAGLQKEELQDHG
jgi:hypothetical protein